MRHSAERRLGALGPKRQARSGRSGYDAAAAEDRCAVPRRRPYRRPRRHAVSRIPTA